MHPSQPQGAIRRKLLGACRLAAPRRSRGGRLLPRAFFLTDPQRTPDLLAIVERLPRGFGVIFRHFGEAGREARGARLARICRRRGIVLLVSADPDLARRIGADGVHWPQARLRGIRPRRVQRPPGWLETCAAHDRQSLARAARLGVDAALLSTVFASTSPSSGAPLGSLRFRRRAREAALPVYALGGISDRTAASAMHGAAGWAAIEGVVAGWGRAATGGA